MVPKREKIKKIENRTRRQRKGLFKEASKQQETEVIMAISDAGNSYGLTHPTVESVGRQRFKAPKTSSSCQRYHHQVQGNNDHTRSGIIKKSDQKDTNDQEIGKKTMEEVEDLQKLHELEELIMIMSRVDELIEEINEEFRKSCST